MIGTFLLLAAVRSAAPAMPVELVTPPGVSCDGTVRTETGSGSAHGVRIRLDSTTCWAPEMRLDAVPDGPMRLTAWPKARLRGEVSVPEGAKLPAELRVALEGSPGPDLRVPRTEIVCPVEDKRFTCDAPRAALDVRLVAGDSIPVHRWDVDPEKPLGKIVLERGASVSGWVVDPRRGSSEPIEVTLTPESFAAGHRTDRRIVKRAQTVRATDRGFFQFRGVATGETYSVTAKRRGRAPASVSGVRVSRAAEHPLDSLELGDLSSIEWTIVPAATPAGDSWRVQVHRRISSAGTLVDVPGAAMLPDQSWRLGDVEPGEYVVVVSDASGTVWHREHVEAGLQPSRFQIRIDAIPVRGVVRFGDTPVEATLTFAREGKRATMRADAQGTFSGSLSGEGEWKVRALLPGARPKRLPERAVEVRRDPESGVAELEIDLPATSISGMVVDESGHPVPGAQIEVRRKGRYDAGGTSDEAGTFEVFGVDAGEVVVRASTDNAESALVPATVAENDDVAVSLVVRRRTLVLGTVVRRGGRTIAGALIRYLGPTGQILEQTTGPSGEFELQVSALTKALDVVVLAPGLPVKITTIPVQPQGVQIMVEDVRGTLAIVFGDESTRLPTVARGGQGFPLLMLVAPRAAGPPREWTDDGMIFDLEPGNYTVCVPPAPCQNVTIVPGGVARAGTREPKGKTVG